MDTFLSDFVVSSADVYGNLTNNVILSAARREESL
jgi:hypothetical protein